MRLDIDSLRNLRAIVESGSFTGAASRLHLTQSAVSRKIKRLEERLGHALLVRNGKSIEPTGIEVFLPQHIVENNTATGQGVGIALPIGSLLFFGRLLLRDLGF